MKAPKTFICKVRCPVSPGLPGSKEEEGRQQEAPISPRVPISPGGSGCDAAGAEQVESRPLLTSGGTGLALLLPGQLMPQCPHPVGPPASGWDTIGQSPLMTWQQVWGPEPRRARRVAHQTGGPLAATPKALDALSSYEQLAPRGSTHQGLLSRVATMATAPTTGVAGERAWSGQGMGR